MGPLTLNWFEVTVVNNTPGVHCVTQRDSQTLPFYIAERKRRGGKGEG